jgi:hypothetical protein
MCHRSGSSDRTRWGEIGRPPAISLLPHIQCWAAFEQAQYLLYVNTVDFAVVIGMKNGNICSLYKNFVSAKGICSRIVLCCLI